MWSVVLRAEVFRRGLLLLTGLFRGFLDRTHCDLSFFVCVFNI